MEIRQKPISEVGSPTPLGVWEEVTMPRRCDIDWRCIQEWSNYDLDFVEEAIRVEKALRAASPKRGFLAPR